MKTADELFDGSNAHLLGGSAVHPSGYLPGFDDWMLKFKETPEWQDDSFCWDEMAATAYRAGMLAAAEIAMKPQPSTTTFCCLSTLSRLADQIRELVGR